MTNQLIGPGCVAEYTGPTQADMPEATFGSYWVIHSYPDEFYMVRCVRVTEREGGGLAITRLYTNAGYFQLVNP